MKKNDQIEKLINMRRVCLIGNEDDVRDFIDKLTGSDLFRVVFNDVTDSHHMLLENRGDGAAILVWNTIGHELVPSIMEHFFKKHKVSSFILIDGKDENKEQWYKKVPEACQFVIYDPYMLTPELCIDMPPSEWETNNALVSSVNEKMLLLLAAANSDKGSLLHALPKELIRLIGNCQMEASFKHKPVSLAFFKSNNNPVTKKPEKNVQDNWTTFGLFALGAVAATALTVGISKSNQFGK